MLSTPFVYVLILNYNQPLLTVTCVNSILSSDYSNFKILVVDNGSNPENQKILMNQIKDKTNLHFVDKNIGYVGGMNYALQKASLENPDYYLVINNDTSIDSLAMKALVETAIRFNDKCIVTGKVYHYDQPDVLQNIGSELKNRNMLEFMHTGADQKDVGQFENETERDLIDDIYWLLPRRVYLQIGGYNTLFFFNGESADYCLRAKKEGFKLLYTPLAKLWHKGGGSIGGRKNNPLLAFYQTKSTLILRFLHLRKGYFLVFYIKIFFLSTKKLLKGLINALRFKRGNFRYYFGEIKGWLSFTFELLLGKYRKKHK